MSRVSVTLWLIIALAATVHADHSTSSCMSSIPCGSVMMIKKIKAMNLSEIKEYESSILTKLPGPWKGLLSLRRSILECQTDITAQMSAYAKKANKHPRRYKFACEFFADYLENCGFEERFKKITDNIKSHGNRDSDTYSTFNSYLEAEFWPQREKYFFRITLEGLLMTVKQLSELESISRETDCTNELMINWSKWLSRTAGYPKLYKIITDYFGLYLDMCGYEDLFKKIKDSIEQVTDGPRFSATYPTLNMYLSKFILYDRFRDDLTEEWVDLLSLIKNFTAETACTEMFIENKLKEILFQGKYRHQLSRELDKFYFVLYSKKCGFEESFKKAIDYIRKGGSSTREPYWYTVDLILSVINEFSALENISKKTECTEKLTYLVKGLIDTPHPLDPEYSKRNFAWYLKSCGFEERFTDLMLRFTQHKILEDESNLSGYLLKMAP